MALVTVLPRPETGAPGGTAVVGRVREAVKGDPAVLGVTGSGPESIDFNHAIYASFPLLLALVALVTFVVLARAFRSLLLAAKAVVLNLASLGAATRRAATAEWSRQLRLGGAAVVDRTLRVCTPLVEGAVVDPIGVDPDPLQRQQGDRRRDA
jgi:hypothetical protein